MLTYDDRIKRINSLGDIAVQIQEAKLYACELRRKLKAGKTLDERLGIHQKVLVADEVVNQLVANVFVLEEAFSAKVAKEIV